MAARQDKATNERHAKTLRELVKQPDNKLCADCKRNDARWASWNIGCFVCIRCSGIHRSMGTHISKVKSVDLDMWTPEQLASVQKWGNRRANLYWEAHLKAGHAPPDHKIDSFIRSKYESRRWAMEGPPPSDPSTLEAGSSASEQASAPVAETSTNLIAPAPARSPPPVTTTVTATAISQPPASRSHQLLSSSHTPRAPSLSAAVASPVAVGVSPVGATLSKAGNGATAQNELFSLDFSAPATSPTSPTTAPKKDVKNDILSLFSAPAPAAQAPVQNAWGMPAAGANPNSSLFGGPTTTAPAQPTTMMGTSGVSMWGADTGWSQPQAAAQPPMAAQPNPFGSFGTQVPAAASNPWAAPQAAANPAFGGAQNLWGAPAPANSSGGFGAFGGGGSNDLFSQPFAAPGPTSSNAAKKQDDAFGDLWSTFK